MNGRAAALAESIGTTRNPAYHGETVGGRFRKWFLRDVLDHAERREPGALARLIARLPDRLRAQVDLGELRSSSPDDTLGLDDAEELLLSVDAILGDGSGRLLEGPGADLATRALGRCGLGVSGDVVATLARLRVPLERPFVDVAVTYELRPTPTGFTLTVGVVGQPRSTRLLRALTTGAIRAAFLYCREATSDTLRLFAETLGDRARFDARYKTVDSEPLAAALPSSKPAQARRSRTLRPTATPLSDEVERIMTRAGLSTPPPLRMPRLPALSSNPPRLVPSRPVAEGASVDPDSSSAASGSLDAERPKPGSPGT
jgi:hypothetical protein